MVKYIDAPFGRYLYVTPPPAYSTHLGSTKKDVTRSNKYVHSATVRRYGGPKPRQQRRPATEGGNADRRTDWSRVDSLIEAVYKPPKMPASYEVRQLAHAGQYRKEQHELPSFRATYFNSAPTHNGPDDFKQTIENFKRAQEQGWRPGTSIQKAAARVAGKPTGKFAEAEDVRLGLGPPNGFARGWAEARTEAVIKAAQRAASRSSRGGRDSSRATSRAKSRAHTLPVIVEEQSDRRRHEGETEMGKSTPYRPTQMDLTDLERWKQERATDAYINEMEKFRKQRHRRFFKELEEVEHEQIDTYHRQLRESKKKYFETVDQQRAQLKDLRDRYLREQIDRFKRFHLRNEDVQQYLETRSIPRDDYGLPEGLEGELPRVFSPKAPLPPKPPSVKSVMRAKNLSNFASIWNQRAAQPNWAPQTVDDEKLLPDIKKFLPAREETPPKKATEKVYTQKPPSRQANGQKPQSRASQKATTSNDKGTTKAATGPQKAKSPKKGIRLATRGSRKFGTRGSKRSFKVGSRQASRGQHDTKPHHDSRMPLIVQKVENRVSPNSPER
ncbi:PREDICTED: uncharacterized protein LOC109487467 [Branchiostoma belcheri]|uniref:Uncharacterized protein LOC109487467 n=1 Tax=Branchiostoma belcheri TaxID=7741 RepID=A0A6P5ALB5_BRABE|nr:PREDICTED: uncharacterized protein LOC109487467 [Branchiostoma belcheri]